MLRWRYQRPSFGDTLESPRFLVHLAVMGTA